LCEALLSIVNDSLVTEVICNEELPAYTDALRQPKHFRLALAYFLWAAAVIVALLFARACHLDSYNVGWGDLAADHRHAVLWWETFVAVIACLGLTILIATVSRLALYSIAAVAAIFWLLGLLGAHGPHLYRVLLLIPQLPGFFAAMMALGVHDEELSRWWAVSINTILYAPVLYTVVARRPHRHSS
jgi:hypothetical protein